MGSEEASTGFVEALQAQVVRLRDENERLASEVERLRGMLDNGEPGATIDHWTKEEALGKLARWAEQYRALVNERDAARAEVERLRRLIDEWLDAHPGIRRMAKGGGDE